MAVMVVVVVMMMVVVGGICRCCAGIIVVITHLDFTWAVLQSVLKKSSLFFSVYFGQTNCSVR